jgi:hypothetical protein
MRSQKRHGDCVMNEPIATEADKDAALAQLASMPHVAPGSEDEDKMMQLVSAVANYVAERERREGDQS